MITGIIKALDVPENFCLTTARELVLSLEKLLAVEFDESAITNVYVSSTPPDTGERGVIWYRLNNSGNFSGIYVFSAGEWLKLFPVTNQLFRVYGNSTVIDPGYALAVAGVNGITTDMFDNGIEPTWYEDPGNPGTYLVFDVVYVGL